MRKALIRATLAKNAVIETLKLRIQKLEAENKELRMQVEIVYGELYKKQ